MSEEKKFTNVTITRDEKNFKVQKGAPQDLGLKSGFVSSSADIPAAKRTVNFYYGEDLSQAEVFQLTVKILTVLVDSIDVIDQGKIVKFSLE